MRRSRSLGAVNLSTANQTLYTAPAGKWAIVKTLVFRNYDAGAQVCTVTFPLEGGGTFAGLSIPMAAGGAIWSGGSWYVYIVIPTGASLKAQHSGANGALTAFGVELDV